MKEVCCGALRRGGGGGSSGGGAVSGSWWMAVVLGADASWNQTGGKVGESREWLQGTARRRLELRFAVTK